MRQRTSITQKSLTQWLQDKVIDLKKQSQSVIQVAPRFARGYLYFFFYEPKGMATLPYYDTFPLILVLDIHADGMTGLNFHYLPPGYRQAFLNKLMRYSASNKEGELERIRISYSILKAARNMREFKPCLKKYLFTHIKSKVLPIRPDEWDMAVSLPFQRFKKKAESTVWRESTDEMKNINTGE